jgi:hypothetical protein
VITPEDAAIVGGFVLLIVGVGLLSIAGACIVAGSLLLLAGARTYSNRS